MNATLRGSGIAVTATAVSAAGILVVAWVVDASPMATGGGWQARTAVILAMAGLWLVTLTRGLNPLILATGVAIGVSWLNYDRIADARSGGPSLVVMLLAVVWTALVGTGRQTAVAVVLSLLASLTYLYDGELASIAGMWLVTVLGAVAARSYASQQRLLLELRQAERSLAEQAVQAERARIAKEVHDVAAHSLAITMLHLTGARMLARRLGVDPQLTEAVDRAERAGRESMVDLRAAVGLLREEPDQAVDTSEDLSGVRPTPTANDLFALVDQYAEAGLPVTTQVRGDLDRLPPLVGLAVYRVTQECLANVVRHAGRVPTRLCVEVSDHCLLTIHDTGRATALTAPGRPPGPMGGHGLPGIRERVAALGGTVAVGPKGGGWQVRVSIPLPAERRG